MYYLLIPNQVNELILKILPKNLLVLIIFQEKFSRVIEHTIQTEEERMNKNKKKKRKSNFESNKKQNKRQKKDIKDANYIEYRPKDYQSEKGFVVNFKK